MSSRSSPKKKDFLLAMPPGLFRFCSGVALDTIREKGIEGNIANIHICPIETDLHSRYGALSIPLSDYARIDGFTNGNYVIVPHNKGPKIVEDSRLHVFHWNCKNERLNSQHESIFCDNVLMAYRECTDNAFLDNVLKSSGFKQVQTFSYDITRKDPNWVEFFGDTVSLDVKIYRS